MHRPSEMHPSDNSKHWTQYDRNSVVSDGDETVMTTPGARHAVPSGDGHA